MKKYVSIVPSSAKTGLTEPNVTNEYLYFFILADTILYKVFFTKTSFTCVAYDHDFSILENKIF